MGNGTLLVALNDVSISGFISLKTNKGLFSREADTWQTLNNAYWID